MLVCEHRFLSTVVLCGQSGPTPCPQLLQGWDTVGMRQWRSLQSYLDL